MIFGPYPATVVRIHDGDTLTLDLDLGFAITLRYNCRVYGVNAPELGTDAGKVALAYVESVLPVGSAVMVVSHGWDKYGGRFDGEITFEWAGSQVSLGAMLLGSGNAVPM